jgi:NAD(P)-dependent dehydrogenase (short-subunit alcohol dehydrogenase family)
MVDESHRVAVVTGGASGIGRASVLALARRGLDVVTADLDEPGAAAVAAEAEALGGRAEAVHCDVASDESVATLASTALERLGRVDVVMANAGVNAAPDASWASWRWLHDINLFGVCRTVEAFLPHLLERGSGQVVATSSGWGVMGQRSAYSTAKWAVIAWCEGLACEVQCEG